MTSSPIAAAPPAAPAQPAQAEAAAARPFNALTVLSISFGHLVHDGFAGFLSPLLPLLIAKLGLSLTAAGSLAAFQSFPSIINPLLGMIGDRLSLRWFAIIAPTLTAVAMCLVGAAPTYTLVALLLIVAGVSSACWHTPTPVMVARAAGRRVGFSMSLLMLGGELARTIGPLVAVGAASLWGIEGLWRLIPVGVFASLVLWWRTKEVGGRVAARAGGSWAGAWRELRRVILPIIGIVATRTFISVSLATYLPTLLNQEGASLLQAGTGLSLVMFGGALGSFATGTLSDRFGRRRVLLTALTLGPLLMLAFLSIQGWLAAPVLFATGFMALSTSPVLMALVQEYGRSKPATANGVYMMIEFVGGAVVTIAVGALADAFGLRSAFLIGAVIALGAAPFVLLLPGRKEAL